MLRPGAVQHAPAVRSQGNREERQRQYEHEKGVRCVLIDEQTETEQGECAGRDAAEGESAGIEYHFGAVAFPDQLHVIVQAVPGHGGHEAGEKEERLCAFGIVDHPAEYGSRILHGSLLKNTAPPWNRHLYTVVLESFVKQKPDAEWCASGGFLSLVPAFIGGGFTEFAEATFAVGAFDESCDGKIVAVHRRTDDEIKHLHWIPE